MPRLRQSPAEKAAAEMEENMRQIGETCKNALRIKYGSIPKAADALGVSSDRLYDILKAPKRMRLADLWMVWKAIDPKWRGVLAGLILP